jgi:hypothetical protein
MNFYYELENAEHLDESKVEFAERALEQGAFVCQQDFEQELDMGHEIHFDSGDVNGAIVADFEIDGDDVYVILDCEDVN